MVLYIKHPSVAPLMDALCTECHKMKKKQYFKSNPSTSRGLAGHLEIKLDLNVQFV